MGIGKRIREARLACHLTQETLAERLGVTKGAVANYENDTSHPKEIVLYRLFSVLSVDANYLYQDQLDFSAADTSVSPEELSLLQDYRRLSGYAKETIRLLIERELHVSEAYGSEKETAAAPSVSAPKETSLPAADTQSHSVKIIPLSAAGAKGRCPDAAQSGEKPLRIEAPLTVYPYLYRIASAGTGSYSADVPTDTIELPFCNRADFVIGVSGDSMEPVFHDGDLLYVERTDRLSAGEIGIFEKEDSIYVKKLGKDRLCSLNPAFPDIYPDSDTIRIIGKVLGKL